jgi:hypothetical protein
MVLCLALDSMHFRRSPVALAGEGEDEGREDPMKGWGEEKRRKMPERWFAASMRALRLAEWETIPRVRTIQVRRASFASRFLSTFFRRWRKLTGFMCVAQTIVLFTQYLQLSSASRGQPSQLTLWLGGAIRLAQVLGLHLLGSNPETMPPEDPAWPPGRNSLKREMAKRLWAVLVYQDVRLFPFP